MSWAETFVLTLGAAAISMVVTYASRTVAIRRALLDQPNARSAHTVPKPRLGGIGVVGALAVATCFLTARGMLSTAALPVIAATVAIAVVGFIDDLRPLKARSRFALQVAAASAVVVMRRHTLEQAAGPILTAMIPGRLLAPFFVLWIVWLTNLYNFMDGIDGLAGGQALIAGVGVALAASAVGATGTAGIALALAGASAGFLWFNFPPSTIFMGDVGSTAIGFLFACLPLMPERVPVPADVVALALALFILDATVTLVRRVAQSARWYEAHRSHYYQRPLALGVGHRAITLASYVGFSMVATGAALMLRVSPGVRLWLPAIAVALFCVAALTVERLEQRAMRRRSRAR